MPTPLQKSIVSAQFEPLIDTLKKKLPPLSTPQKYNQCVDIFSKWRGNFFYIMQKYKVGGDDAENHFEVGLARFEFLGADQFNIAFFRHTGKWYPLIAYDDSSLEEAKKALLEEPMLQVY